MSVAATAPRRHRCSPASAPLNAFSSAEKRAGGDHTGRESCRRQEGDLQACRKELLSLKEKVGMKDDLLRDRERKIEQVAAATRHTNVQRD